MRDYRVPVSFFLGRRGAGGYADLSFVSKFRSNPHTPRQGAGFTPGCASTVRRTYRSARTRLHRHRSGPRGFPPKPWSETKLGELKNETRSHLDAPSVDERSHGIPRGRWVIGGPLRH